MPQNDIGRVVSLIMENPELLEQIKALAEKDAKEPVENAALPTPSESEDGKSSAVNNVAQPTSISVEAKRPVRRTELLEALKPYISDERKKAIESFITIADILELMRAK